jgi:soluble lytic murein transglycosylase
MVIALIATFICSSIGADSYAAEVRVLQRDVAQGGPPEVDSSTLNLYFDGTSMRHALRELNAGSGAEAIDAIPAFLHDYPDHAYAPQARFALGYAYYVEERWEHAFRTLTQAAEELPILSSYSNFWAGMAAEELGRYSEAMELADKVTNGSEFGPRSRFLKARALIMLDRVDEGIAMLEAFIEEFPGAWYREQVDLELAEAYERQERWAEAARIYKRVMIVYPDSEAESEASEHLDRVLEKLPPDERETFEQTDMDDVLMRANALYERHRSERVIELVVEHEGQLDVGTDTYCEALYLKAKSYSKLRQHSNSIPPYETIETNCSGETKLKALYNMGRAYWNIDRPDDAIGAFERLVGEFPQHSYADDALLYIARIHREQSEREAYVATLNRQIASYPEGDMRKDAVWLLVIDEYRQGNHSEVVRFIDSLNGDYGEDDLYSRGRLAYFRARSLEAVSRGTEARASYRDLIESQPLGYYALLAFQRLQQIDSEYAALLEESIVANESEPSGTEPVSVPTELASHPGFSRGRVLIRLGLLSLAEDEFDELRAETNGQVEVDRALSTLLQRAGAFHLGYRGPASRVAHTTSYPNHGTIEDWLLAYPQPFKESVMEYAAERGLDSALVYAIMREESRFQADIESWANARGLMQLMYGTASDMAEMVDYGPIDAEDLFEPETNIALGTRFMKLLAERFASHPFLIAAGYNGGAGSVSSWLTEFGDLELDLWVEEIPYKQTRHYVKRVIRTWWVYHWLYDEDRVVGVSYDLP